MERLGLEVMHILQASTERDLDDAFSTLIHPSDARQCSAFQLKVVIYWNRSKLGDR
jgi:hypothetical protein